MSGTPPPAARTERALLDLLGLARRAGAVTPGTDAVRSAVRDGKVRGVLLAADAAPGQVEKLLPLLEARAVPHATCFTRETLGAALGRGLTSAAGITNENFARRVLELAAALPFPQD